MIYSRFGTKLTLVSKQQDTTGRVLLQATAEGTAGTLEYGVGDLKADQGSTEIEQAVAALPWKVVQRKPGPGQRTTF